MIIINKVKVEWVCVWSIWIIPINNEKDASLKFCLGFNTEYTVSVCIPEDYLSCKHVLFIYGSAMSSETDR